jgi:hypothetical protein
MGGAESTWGKAGRQQSQTLSENVGSIFLKIFIGDIDQQGVQEEKGKKEVHAKKSAFDNDSPGEIDGMG